MKEIEFEVALLENPVFKLEKVVRAKAEEEMQDFEGPLDLILFLLSKNKMEIQDISISQILDQYLPGWRPARSWIWRWPANSSPWPLI